jgi:hypothetical protein
MQIMQEQAKQIVKDYRAKIKQREAKKAIRN